jgi:hypothetical protein
MPDSRASRRRAQRLAAILLLGTFVLGGSVGWTVSRTMVAHAEAPPVGPLVHEFAVEVGLSPPQRAAVDSILDVRQRIIDSLVAPVRGEIERAREDARARIRARLTDGQRPRFDAYVARTRRADSAHRAAHPAPATRR